MHDSEAYGKGLVEQVKRALNARGVQEVALESVRPGQVDFGPLLSRLAEVGAEIVYYGGYSPVSFQPVLDHPHPNAVGPVPPVLLGGVDRRQIRAVGEPRLARQPQVALHPPEQVGAGGGRRLPQRVAEEPPVGQAQHARPQRRQHVMGQRRLALLVAARAGAEQHVRAVLDQGHEAELREGALATARLGATEGGAVLVGVGVGDVEAGAVQADQPPPPAPGAPRGGRRHGPHHLFVQAARRRLAQARAGLRDAALARHPDRLGAPEPARPFQESAQDLPGAGGHVDPDFPFDLDRGWHPELILLFRSEA